VSGLKSRLKQRIVINTTPDLYDRFYRVKMEARRHYKMWAMDNADFLQKLLDALEEKMVEERWKKALRAY
jgi:hypothetical protein